MPVITMEDVGLEPEQQQQQQPQQQQKHQQQQQKRKQPPATSHRGSAAVVKNRSIGNNRPCCISSIKNFIVTALFLLVLIGLGVFGYVYFFGTTKQIPGISTFRDVDPFANLNPAYAAKWPTSGTGGLDMTILNALDSKWLPYFQQAVSDWDHGTPDALTLSTQRVSVDHSCTPVDGVIKVCNGNFGATGWRGINTAALNNNIITSSVAKMNEYYFQSSEDTQYMQYTMCHEIGHGFGLNHTDENMNNLNLGNCMDYTDRPESNEHPDVTNYDVLEKLYGTVDGSSSSSSSSGSSATASPSVQGSSGTTSYGGNRKLMQNLRGSASSGQTLSWVWDKIGEIESTLSCPTCEPRGGARRLYVGKAFETLEYDLGNGYTVRFHIVHH